jgi:hypothetical protein
MLNVHLKYSQFKYFVITTIILLLVGCSVSPTTITSKVGSKTSYSDFIKGEAILPEGNPGSMVAMELPYWLNNSQDYLASALYILEMLPSNNLVYNTLGYSAEHLGYFEASIEYYEKSKDWSWTNALCIGLQKNAFPYFCNIYNPDESIKRVKAKMKQLGVGNQFSDIDYEAQVVKANSSIEQMKSGKYHSDILNTSNTYRSTDDGTPLDIGKIFRTLVAVAIVAYALTDEDDSDSSSSCETKSGSGIDYDCYHKRAQKIGKKRVKDGSKFNIRSRASLRSSLQTTQHSPPRRSQSIQAAPVAFSNISTPSNSGNSAQPVQMYSQPVKTHSQSIQNQNITKDGGGCSSDYNCGIGQICTKAPLSSGGVCMDAVDRNGMKTFPIKDPSSVLPNMTVDGQCSTNMDCPTTFRCDSHLKVCTK